MQDTTTSNSSNPTTTAAPPPLPTTYNGTASSTIQSTIHPQITLRTPSKYQSSSPHESEAADWTPPTLEWMARTWWVTHSTLPMWRKAKNVKITYSILPVSKAGEGKGEGVICLDDVVESEPTSRTWMPQPREIRGVDTPDTEVVAGWNWRGRGLLKIASSRWEVLGWGERDLGEGGNENGEKEKERWVITWFAPSLFTPAGVDVYSDRKKGGSGDLVRDVLEALEGMSCKEVSDVCKGEMREVVRDL